MIDSYGPQSSEQYDELLTQYAYGYHESLNAGAKTALLLNQVLFDCTETVTILDLGAGTGAMSLKILQESRNIFAEPPLYDVTLLDASEAMLKVAQRNFEKQQLPPPKRILGSFQADFTGTYDLIISSYAIHHLNRDEKQKLFQSIRSNLSAQGVFVLVDRMVDCHAIEYDHHLSIFAKKAQPLFERMTDRRTNGTSLSLDECKKIAHEQFVLDGDQPDSVEWHLETFRNIGFRKSSLTYYNFGFAVVSAWP